MPGASAVGQNVDVAVRNRIRPRLVKAGVGLVVLIVVAFGLSGTDLAEVEVARARGSTGLP